MLIKQHHPIIFILLLFLFFHSTLWAQEMPPRPVFITTSIVQHLNFGAFSSYNSGGSVIIGPTGSRSSTGDIVLMSSIYTTALIYVEGNPGTLISIFNGPDVMLNGSNGGYIILHIGDSNPDSPFVIPPSPSVQTLQIGGTLIVGSPPSNPPGTYSGNFSVTFMQE